jgi:uncharacterized phiE125 gp8 family phage protein
MNLRRNCMMLVEQTSVPVAALPVAEFKDHLRLGTGFGDGNVQDEVLETCLRAAMSAIEARTGKALIEKQFLFSLTAWRDACAQVLPVAPVVSLVSVTVLDRAGGATVLDPSGYSLVQDQAFPRLQAAGVLPTIPTGGSAEVVFLAGFGSDWTGLPDDLLRAVYLLAADYYEGRNTKGLAGAGFSAAVQSLLEPHRRMRMGWAV